MISEVSLYYEQQLWQKGVGRVAGVDEAGRGPLAGPVVAAAVMFPAGCLLPGADDSKKLRPSRREEVFAEIQARATAIGVGIVDHEEIDRINILQATFKAMGIALDNLSLQPDHVLVDGNRFAGGVLPFTTIVHGDALCQAIAAASIIAKVTRDRIMCEQDVLYPEYGFARHKGYGTVEHRAAIEKHGLCPIHRRSFCHNYSE